TAFAVAAAAIAAATAATAIAAFIALSPAEGGRRHIRAILAAELSSTATPRTARAIPLGAFTKLVVVVIAATAIFRHFIRSLGIQKPPAGSHQPTRASARSLLGVTWKAGIGPLALNHP
ncbi:hypothetical protein, partial [Afifella sp. IM 167]|uniref:hypothetical protein n=1 Tax=Afifella sp. IM 167 TaxID=2033586 RepID=UPI001CCD387E